MKQVTTCVGIDAHKKDLFVAMLVGAAPTPVTWQLANEPAVVRRIVRKLKREAPGPVHVTHAASVTDTPGTPHTRPPTSPARREMTGGPATASIQRS